MDHLFNFEKIRAHPFFLPHPRAIKIAIFEIGCHLSQKSKHEKKNFS